MCQPSGPGSNPGGIVQSQLVQGENPIEPVTFGSVFLSEARRRAVGWGTPEFPGQLIALLLVAQWLERLCAILVAQI